MINPNVTMGNGQLVALINAELARIAAHNTQMTQVVERLARVTITSGQAAVPAMALPGTQPVTVTLKTVMPDTTYSATATLSGGINLLSTLSIVGVTDQTPTTVTVHVRSTGVLSAGATLTVHAVRHS